jgi:hypothetical protein
VVRPTPSDRAIALMLISPRSRIAIFSSVTLRGRSNSANAANRVQLQAPRRRGRVDALAQRPKRDAASFEIPDHLHEMAQRSAQTIQTPDHERVPGPDVA